MDFDIVKIVTDKFVEIRGILKLADEDVFLVMDVFTRNISISAVVLRKNFYITHFLYCPTMGAHKFICHLSSHLSSPSIIQSKYCLDFL